LKYKRFRRGISFKEALWKRRRGDYLIYIGQPDVLVALKNRKIYAKSPI